MACWQELNAHTQASRRLGLIDGNGLEGLVRGTAVQGFQIDFRKRKKRVFAASPERSYSRIGFLQTQAL